MAFSIFDVVALVEDLPKENLKAGARGTVIDVYTQPCEAYEIEFCDDVGRTIALLALLPNQVTRVL